MSLVKRVMDAHNEHIVFSSDNISHLLLEDYEVDSSDVKGKVKCHYTIIVYSGNEGNYNAHFHVINNETGKSRVDTCFLFEQPKQFNHGPHNKPITSKAEMKEIVKLLNAIDKSTGNTVFIEAIRAWNATKPDAYKVDETIDVPNYLLDF